MSSNYAQELQDSLLTGMESAMGGMVWMTTLTSVLKGSATSDKTPEMLVAQAIAIANLVDEAHRKRERDKVLDRLSKVAADSSKEGE